MTTTTNPVPVHAARWIEDAIKNAGIDASLDPRARATSPYCIGFGDVDTPRGHLYRLYLSGTPGGGYEVEVTDHCGDGLAVGSGLHAQDVVDLVVATNAS